VTTTKPFMTDAELQKSWPQLKTVVAEIRRIGRTAEAGLLVDASRRAFALSVAYQNRQRLFSDCGILPFRRPRTAPHVWGVNVRCVERVDLSPIPIKYVYGSRLD
jgi:hypothetical protein